MRKVIILFLAMVLLLFAAHTQAAFTGDPTDGNDGVMTDARCNFGDGTPSPVQLWLCEIAMMEDAWWDSPW